LNTKLARDAWLRALRRTADIDSHPDLTLPVLIERLAQQYEAAPATFVPAPAVPDRGSAEIAFSGCSTEPLSSAECALPSLDRAPRRTHRVGDLDG
jgi:hypothetical protein